VAHAFAAPHVFAAGVMVSCAEPRRRVPGRHGLPNLPIGGLADLPPESTGRARCNPDTGSVRVLRGALFPAARMCAPAFPSLATLAPDRAPARGVNLTEA